MDWIDSLASLGGVVIGWLLSEKGKISSDKKQDDKKLNKLLYYLLELRYYFTRELELETDLNNFIEKGKVKIQTKFNIDQSEMETESEIWKPIILELFSKVKESSNFEFIENNINDAVTDLAEIFPILAYELSGNHNLKDRLNKVDNYLNDVESHVEFPFEIKNWIQPKLTKELLNDIDFSINKVSQKIDTKTNEEALIKIAKMDRPGDNSELENFFDEYLKRIEDSFQ